MAGFNKNNQGARKTVNKSGHAAYSMDDKTKLVTMVLTSMFGEPKFYGDNTNELVALAEQSDMNFVHRLAAYARKEMNLRSVSHGLTAIVAKRVEWYSRRSDQVRLWVYEGRD